MLGNLNYVKILIISRDFEFSKTKSYLITLKSKDSELVWCAELYSLN